MKKIIVGILLIALFCKCDKHKWFAGPNNYADNFEMYPTTDSLLLPLNKNWSYTQITVSGNAIELDTLRPHSGKQCLKFIAKASAHKSVSKSSITKQHMAFWEGETVRLSAWFYLSDTLPHPWLFIMDLEEQAAVGAGPGMRLALVDGFLRVEHKYNEKDVVQLTGKEIAFPRNQWVEIVWEVLLSKKNTGTIKLIQGKQILIDRKNHKTLPTDILYFQQGTKGMYSSCEVGVTANGSDNACTLFVDDVVFEKVQ